jgi:hypothetical protein
MYAKERKPIVNTYISKFNEEKAINLSPDKLIEYCDSLCEDMKKFGIKDGNLLSSEVFTNLNSHYHFSDTLIDWFLDILVREQIGYTKIINCGRYGDIPYIFFTTFKKSKKGKIGNPLQTRFLAIHKSTGEDLMKDRTENYEFRWHVGFYGYTENLGFQELGERYCWGGFIDNSFFQIFKLKLNDKFSNKMYNYYFDSYLTTPLQSIPIANKIGDTLVL